MKTQVLESKPKKKRKQYHKNILDMFNKKWKYRSKNEFQITLLKGNVRLKMNLKTGEVMKTIILPDKN